jgi:sec-independent protein translocase protein TatA
MRLDGPGLLTIFSGPDILLIVLVFVLLFGGKKIPDLARGLGESIRNFRGAVKSEEDPNEQKKL